MERAQHINIGMYEFRPRVSLIMRGLHLNPSTKTLIAGSLNGEGNGSCVDDVRYSAHGVLVSLDSCLDQWQ